MEKINENEKLEEYLINCDYKDEKKAEYIKNIFEQYRLCVEMADKISERRQTANSFYLSLCTALISVLGYLLIEKKAEFYSNLLWLPPVFGLFISYTWYRLILSFRGLNNGKFKVIRSIEYLLPIKPYNAEEFVVGAGKNKKLYHPFTTIEAVLPWMFFIAFFIILLSIVPWKDFL